MTLTVSIGATLAGLTNVTSAVRLDSLSIKETGHHGVGVLDLILQEPGTTPLPEWFIRVLDGSDRAFEGKIRNRTRSDTGLGPTPKRLYTLTCQDNTSLLTDDVCDSASADRPTEHAQQRIVALVVAFSRYLTAAIPGSGGYVQDVGGNLDPKDYTGMTLYDAISDIAGSLSADFYADYYERVHFFATETEDAPWDLSDAPNGSTTFGYRDLSLPDDTFELVNAVYCQGDPGTTTPVWRPDPSTWPTASHTAYGRREGVLNATDISTQGALVAAGDAYIAKNAWPTAPVTLKCFRPGLRAGMQVGLTSALWSLSGAQYPVVEWSASVLLDDRQLVYELTLGSKPITLPDIVQDASAYRPPPPGSLTSAMFAANIHPPQVVDALPALPDQWWPEGSLVFLTTDKKLYRCIDGTTWSVAVDGEDIEANSITAGQIAAGAIGADELAANSVVAGKIAAHSIAADRLQVGDRFPTITNPDFEHGDLWGWNVYPAAGGQIYAEDQGTSAMVGRWVAVIYNAATPGGRIASEGTLTPARAGDRWVLSAWLRGEGGGGANAQLVLNCYSTSGWIGSVYSGQFATGNGVWTHHMSVLTAIAGTVYVTFGVENDSANRYLVIDDCQMQRGATIIDRTGITIYDGALGVVDVNGKTTITGGRIAAQTIEAGMFYEDPVNLIQNPGWEDGWWSGVHQDRTQETPRHGAYNGKLVSVGVGTVTMESNIFPVRPGFKYQWRIWGRGNSTSPGNAGMAAGISWLDVNGGVISQAWGFANWGQNNNWGAFGNVGVAPSNARFAQIWPYVDNTGGGAYTYWDDAECYQVDTDINHGGGNVVINGNGVTITDGKLTVSNPNAVVIIDGSSNMFKIVASGTATVSASGAGQWTGNWSPGMLGLPGNDSAAYLAFVAEGTAPASNAYRFVGEQAVWATGYVAPSSGGSPVNASKYIRYAARTFGTANGTAPWFALLLDSAESGSHGFHARYHMLKEAAI